MVEQKTLIHECTFQAKDEIKRLGGKWNPTKGGWDMPNQAAYDKALSYCNTFKARKYEDSDAVEDAPGWLKSVDWMFQRESSLPAAIPLKENKGKAVKSGLKIAGIRYEGEPRTAHDIWIVTCKKEEWGNKFAVINEQTLGCKFMGEEEIRGCVWYGEELGLAKRLWHAFLEQ